MTNLILAIILGLFASNFSFSQDKDVYNVLVNEAWNLYQAEDYKHSAEKYSKAFIAWGNKGYNFHRYNAARAWAIAKEPDSAFVQLFRIANKGHYSRYGRISTDPDLEELNCDDRWAKVLRIVKENKEKAERKIDRQLMAVLDTIYEEDQEPRRKLAEVEEEYGRKSEEMNSLIEEIDKKDTINLIKVRKILDERGWLGSDVVGRQGNSTLFLVIQHASLKVQEKYLPMFRVAVKKGNGSQRSLALMEDRVALRKGGRQIYGSQIGRDTETGEYYVSPLEDPENVDSRRAEVGMGKLKEYVSGFGIDWNARKYKENLAELEARLNKD